METTKMKKTQNLESRTMMKVEDIVVEDENHGDVDDYILSGRLSRWAHWFKSNPLIKCDYAVPGLNYHCQNLYPKTHEKWLYVNTLRPRQSGRRKGDKQLSESALTRFTDAYMRH